MFNSNFKKKLAIYIFLFILVILSANFYYNSLLSPADSSDQSQKRFIVYKGESSSSVADRLEKEGLIKSAVAFKIYLKTSGKTGIIQAGEFELFSSMSTEELVEELKTGVVEKWVTLLEGWRIEEMAQKLSTELGVDSKEFIKVAKEGYMFPDTYLIDPNFSPSQIVKMLRNNFDKKYNDELQARIKAQGLTPEEGVILASIVEREARSFEVRKMVASILLKRFKIGMGLNADATVQYALIPQGTKKAPSDGWWKRHLTRTDLKISSPYNTYIYAGFPPTPIANPSLSSLEAVAEANPSLPYLYYYHDSQGRSHYGRTLEEHNQNIARYP